MSGVASRTVAEAEAGLRLDRWFRQHYPGLAHGRLERLLRTGQVRVDGRRARAGTRLEVGQVVRIPPVEAPAARPPAPRAGRPVDDKAAEMLRRAVLHVDDAIIVINKPAGLAVQGGRGVGRNVDAMLDALRFGSDERPRLVHRLDQDTSGLLVLARTAPAARALTAAFRSRDAEKVYWAIVVGAPPAREGTLRQRLAKSGGPGGERVRPDAAGKSAVTLYRVIDSAGRQASWLELRPLTGRTHQLRVHCAAAGMPILGDGKYGGRAAFLADIAESRRLHLHARALSLPHPAGGQFRIEAPPPAFMIATMQHLGFEPGDAAATSAPARHQSR
jgi:23S rRNA pseudouridine955/2504/2580 synthase